MPISRQKYRAVAASFPFYHPVTSFISILSSRLYKIIFLRRHYLGIAIDDTSKDELLIQLINAASQWVITTIGRDIMKNDYSEKKKGYGKQKITLNNYPIREIKKVYRISTGAEIVSPSVIGKFTNKHELENGVVYLDSGFSVVGYNYGLEPDIYPYSRYIGIDYIAGYVFPSQATEDEPCDLPADLIQLVIERIKFDYYQSLMGADGLSSFSIGGVSWGFKEAPTEEWQKTLNKYIEAY